MTVSIERYPRIIIQYCNKCKWQNRAVWYLQEILQTFPEEIQDISLQPILDQPGVFQIVLVTSNSASEIIYKRKFKSKELQEKYADEGEEKYTYDGFPDSKFIKVLIKNKLGLQVGKHIDRGSDYKLNDGTACVDCRKEE
ncbi:uncharacterized protein SPAPADRAFT_132690 [Spathaspora passalidarum NRRL Y-27907]|uniref:Selenoprotein W n=1 Tax=Spathaspora passalidarum (strain NRRL Y-27907 / 11-Y1) TaxID=619300 RepID=G3AEF7_SPAPN|nr:uncharacterized protein SPAPADRAFT_132690 [Spathaspora passalidarum NRRL Y-27907]EGW35746.1 hypothetical protein SPAPADRAFT_132690 [Spathaspora passalidarum NRRL Y-27907]